MEMFIGAIIGFGAACVIGFFVYRNNKAKITEAVDALSTGENISSDAVKKVIEILKK